MMTTSQVAQFRGQVVRSAFALSVGRIVALATLLLGLVSTSSSASTDPALLPQCYRFGKDGLLGFVSVHGSVVTDLKFQYASEYWRAGCLWVRQSVADRLSGNFIAPDGKELFAQQFGGPPDPMDPDPFFTDGIALVRVASNRWVYVNNKGAVLFDAQWTQMWVPPEVYLLPMRRGEKCGYGTRSGEIRIAPQFQRVKPFQGGVAPVCDEGRWGLIDESGAFVLKPRFDAVVTLGEEANTWACQQSGKWGLARSDGTMTCLPRFDAIGHCNGRVATFRRGALWGLVTVEGKVLVKPGYDAVEGIGEGVFLARRDGRWGVVDFDGRPVHPFRFTYVNGYHPLAPKTCSVWEESDKRGFINRKGQLLFGKLFRETDKHSGSGILLFRETAAGWGIGNEDGVILAQPQYERIKGYESYKDRLAIVKDRNGWGLLDLSSRTLIVSCTYSDLNRWNDLFAAAKDGVYTLFGMTGAEVVSPKLGITGLPKPHEMVRGYGTVRAKSGTGVITQSGQLVFPLEYEDAGIPAEDRIPVKKEGLWGYLDMAGEVVIARQFAWAGSFREGVAAVKIGDRYGFIDRTGKLLIRPTYADAGYSLHGLLPVALTAQGDGADKRKWGLVNHQGEIVLPLEYDCIEWGDLQDGKTRFYGRICWQHG